MIRDGAEKDRFICHSCANRDSCEDGKTRDYRWGPIIIECTSYKEDI